MDSPHSFDTRRFRFALGVLAVVLCLFSSVKYGTSFAATHLETREDTSLTTELKILEVQAKRAQRSEGEIALLERLHTFDRSRAARADSTASSKLLAAARERMIGVDLSRMVLYLFEEGYATAVLPLESKGVRGTSTETPKGLFAIESKDVRVASTDGTPLPHALQFFGSSFIHGPIASTSRENTRHTASYLQLSDADAARVMAFATVGTPLFIIEDNVAGTPLTLKNTPLPRVSAASFLIADISTGTVYGAHNASEILPIASLSKLLVALVAEESIPPDQRVAITSADRVQAEDTPGSLLAGDTFRAGELLYPLLMESNNAVAYALARDQGESTFVAWMNEKADLVGMHHTSFEEPSGLSPQNTSSAEDLLTLMRYIHTNHSYILNISRTPAQRIKAESGRSYTLGNFNVFSASRSFVGGKTGYTDEARETMTAVFDIPVQGATSTIAVIVLGSKDRKADVEKLTAWFKKAVL